MKNAFRSPHEWFVAVPPYLSTLQQNILNQMDLLSFCRFFGGSCSNLKRKNKILEDLEDACQNIWRIPIPKSVPSVSSENSGKVVGFICWGEQSFQETRSC